VMLSLAFFFFWIRRSLWVWWILDGRIWLNPLRWRWSSGVCPHGRI
jgi:hypothetical protein